MHSSNSADIFILFPFSVFNSQSDQVQYLQLNMLSILDLVYLTFGLLICILQFQFRLNILYEIWTYEKLALIVLRAIQIACIASVVYFIVHLSKKYNVQYSVWSIVFVDDYASRSKISCNVL